MASSRRMDRFTVATAVLGILVLLNVLGLRVFGRADLTRNHEFSLSKASISAVHTLEDPVVATAYFTADMPPQYAMVNRYVRDLLDEYHNQSGGNFNYVFVDPVGKETDEDKQKKHDVQHDIFGRSVREATSVEKELSDLGIPPVQVQVAEDDQWQVKRAYMGIALRYNDKVEVIPVVKDTQGLEYEITTAMRKLTGKARHTVGVVYGRGAPELKASMKQFETLIGQMHNVENAELASGNPIPPNADALVVIGGTEPFTEEEQRIFDGYVMAGKSVAFLLSPLSVSLENLQYKEANHGLFELLRTYGAQIEPGLTLDVASASINVTTQMENRRMMQQVRYPFLMMPQALNSDHPVTRGLSQMVFPFMSPVKTTFPVAPEVKAEVLASSSPKSWVQVPPYNLDPMQRWTLDGVTGMGVHDLVVSLSGKIPSHFGAESKGNGRVIVAGGSGFLSDPYMAAGVPPFVLNMLDWMMFDDELLSVRTRGLSSDPIDPELSDTKRNFARYSNILGLPALFMAYGVVRWRRREHRRLSVSL